jgi:hypothetical protein
MECFIRKGQLTVAGKPECNIANNQLLGIISCQDLSHVYHVRLSKYWAVIVMLNGNLL